jgi:hypothetical protein
MGRDRGTAASPNQLAGLRVSDLCCFGLDGHRGNGEGRGGDDGDVVAGHDDADTLFLADGFA